MSRDKLFLLPMAFITLAHAEGTPEFRNIDFDLVARCASAAHIATYAAETFPQDEKNRLKFVTEMIKNPELANKLGDKTPTIVEAITSIAAVEGLLTKNKNPKSSQQMHDWFVAQSSATCALAGSARSSDKR